MEQEAEENPENPRRERGAEGARLARLEPPNLSGKRKDHRPEQGALPGAVHCEPSGGSSPAVFFILHHAIHVISVVRYARRTRKRGLNGENMQFLSEAVVSEVLNLLFIP